MVADPEGEPQQNGIVERLNRTSREDVLDVYLFRSDEHAQQIADTWLDEYNTRWPHQSLGYKTLSE